MAFTTTNLIMGVVIFAMKVARFFLQLPTFSLMFLVQIGNVMMLNEIILHHGFPNIHTLQQIDLCFS
jgi:hypothetical protein